MTLQLLVILFVWLAFGCLVAWLIGKASDIGGQEDDPIGNDSTATWYDHGADSIELPEFAAQSRHVRIVLSRE
jgi:hypothetical protein